jgi:hypothetical protein
VGEFVAHEALYFHKEAAKQEGNDEQENEEGKYVAGAKDDTVDDVGRVECFIDANDAIGDHFYTAYQYDAEAPEYQSMHEANDGTAEYLGLSEGYFQRKGKALGVVAYGKAFGEAEETPEPPDGVGKHAEGEQDGDDEHYLFGHKYFVRLGKHGISGCKNSTIIKIGKNFL